MDDFLDGPTRAHLLSAERKYRSGNPRLIADTNCSRMTPRDAQSKPESAYDGEAGVFKTAKANKVNPDIAEVQWFNMPAQELRPNIKREIQLLRMRNVLDEKRHYKKQVLDKLLSKEYQLGVVIEGRSDSSKDRIPRKGRATNMIGEVLAVHEAQKQVKKRYTNIQKSKSSGKKRTSRMAQ